MEHPYLVSIHYRKRCLLPGDWATDVLLVEGVREIPDPRRVRLTNPPALEVYMTLEGADVVRKMFGGILNVALYTEAN